jgi:hypothetical protein
MKLISKYISSIVIAILLTSTVYSQKFQATVDKTTVGQNERFQVYFTFEGAAGGNISNFTPPGFKGFNILSGPNQSTSMKIENGRTTSSITLSYWINASQMGEFTIGSASANYSGKQYKTNPVKIKVVKGSAQPAQAQQQGNISQEDIGENVFIVATPNKRSVYRGEQVTVTYKLYTRLEISSPQINKLPSYQGFWAEELESGNNIRFEIEMYKNQRFRSAVIKKVALFPTKSGELEVTPFELTIPVIVKRKNTGRDIFDDFFNDSFFGRRETVEHLAKSNKVMIDVKDLPTENVPESFNGAVGNYKFSAALDRTDVETNESITLKMAIRGNGNIKLLDLPKIELPTGFEKYDPKTRESITRKSTVSGSKTAEYLIVPRIAGEKIIPAVEFSYFNPSTKKYVTSRSPEFNISVKKGKSTVETAVSGYSKEDVKLLTEDIRFIKTSDFNFTEMKDQKIIRSWFWYSLILPLMIFIGFIGVKKRQDKLSGNLQLRKYQKAEKTAKARLKNAKKVLAESDIARAYNELSLALFGYLEDKLGLQKSEFTQDRVLSELLDRGVNKELVDKAKDILDKCEFARFAPQMQDEKTCQDLYDQAVEVIINLENSILMVKKK